MSFKRVDDDTQTLHELRRRRVGDLLREDLADDEVSRLSNGRLVCMVCYHRPIFDTLDMFYVHRKGKKHTLNAGYKAEEKQELEDLILKCKHEQFVKTGNTDIKQAPAEAPKILGFAKPYDPRTKKQPRPYDRKMTLDIHIKDSTDGDRSFAETTRKEQLPGNSKEFPGYRRKTKISLEKAGTRKSEMKISNHHRNNTDTISDTECNERQEFKCNYKAKHTGKHLTFNEKNSAENNSILHPNQLGKFVQTKGVEKDPRYYIERRKRFKTETTKLETEQNRNAVTNASSHEGNVTVDWQNFQKYKAAIMSGSFKSASSKSQKQKGTESICDHVENSEAHASEPCHQSSSGSDFQDISCTTLSSMTETSLLDKKEKAKKELQLRGAGWKRDWTGKWVRDEEAEFDSDEETPDLP